MQKVSKILRWLTALSTILMLGCLGWQCIDIYLQGSDAAALESIYTYEDVASRLSVLAIPALLYALLVILTWLTGRFDSEKLAGRKAGYSHKEACAAASDSSKRAGVRWCILFVGIALVLWGAVNGSLYDVLVKSINICTECIGLG